MDFSTQILAVNNPLIQSALNRQLLLIDGNRITYKINQQKSYDWTDPEEWVRAYTIAWLVLEMDYPANRIRTEVTVPRRTPNDWADVVVFSDDQCREPFLIIENKAYQISESDKSQGIEQLFGNCNSLRAPLGLYEQGKHSHFFDILNFPPTERKTNLLGVFLTI